MIVNGRILWGALLGACISPPPAQDRRPDGGKPPPPSALEVRPASGVSGTMRVAVALTQPVTLAASDYPVSVSRKNGEPIEVSVSLSPTGTEIGLIPLEPWPKGEVIAIDIGPGFVGTTGEALAMTGTSLEFTTADSGAAGPMSAMAADTATAAMVLRSPSPGEDAPLNLAFISVEVSPPEAAAELEHLFLADDRGSVRADVVASSEDGIVLASLPRFSGPCAPLCPVTTYRVSDGVGGALRTSSTADAVAPVLTSSTVLTIGDQIAIDLALSKPVLLHGSVIDATGMSAPLALPLIAASEIRVDPGALLAPNASYTFTIDGTDLAGNALSTISISVLTPERIEATIDELVPTPLHDWNNSDGTGVAFGPYPGNGAVTSADEWIEIINRSSVAIDLTTSSLVLRKVDAHPTETVLGTLSEAYFGNGGSLTAWGPGEAMVFHPKGAMSKRGFAFELILGPRLLDRVAVGDVDNAVSPSTTPPDSAHEALAKDIEGTWRWCVPNPGDPLPPRDCI
jgi:hypothetical protein